MIFNHELWGTVQFFKRGICFNFKDTCGAKFDDMNQSNGATNARYHAFCIKSLIYIKISEYKLFSIPVFECTFFNFYLWFRCKSKQIIFQTLLKDLKFL